MCVVFFASVLVSLFAAAPSLRGQAQAQGLSFDDLLASRLATVPMGRGGRPDEVGSLCAYLCSDNAAFMTGQLLILDGGKVRTLY